MVYHLQSETSPLAVYPEDFKSLGKIFEKAVDLMQYMEDGTELFICNEFDKPLYSIKFTGTDQFTIRELR